MMKPHSQLQEGFLLGSVSCNQVGNLSRLNIFPEMSANTNFLRFGFKYNQPNFRAGYEMALLVVAVINHCSTIAHMRAIVRPWAPFKHESERDV